MRTREAEGARALDDDDADPQVRRLQERLRRHQDSCGCESGAAAMVGAAVAYGVWLLTRPSGLWPLSLRDVLAGLGVVAAATVAGKLAGLAWARARAAAVRRRLDALRAGGA